MNKKIKNRIKSIKDGVLEQVRSGKVSMHSPYYFVLRNVLVALGVIFLFGLALYIASMIGFIVMGNGMGTLPEFGFVGLFIMMRSLPWLLILISGVLILVLEFFGAQFSFVYKRPLIYSLLGVSILIIAGGSILAQTSMHHKAFALGEEYQVPFVSRMYQGYVLRKDNDVYIGTISTITDNAVELILRDGESKTINLTDNTKRPLRRALEQGMMVMIVVNGEYTEEALGIRPLERKHMLMPRRQSR